MNTFSQQLSAVLEPIASWFRTLGVPEPIVQWGHPAMMAIVVFVMGSFVGYAGWRSRLATDETVIGKSRSDHRQLAPLMFLFIALGYTGGVLSLVMQQHSILESPHFWAGSTVLVILGLNGAIAALGFSRPAETGKRSRTIHAYLGSAALGLLLLHAALGLKLGLSI
jgi:fucose 4-O-acetylase-like acetyltransferase